MSSSNISAQQFEKDASHPVPEGIDKAIQAVRHYLLSQQHSQGYWVAELKADTTLPSDYILMMHFLGIDNPEKVSKLCRFILSHQLEDGSWNIYPGGPGEISATVKAYTALKLAGYAQGDPRLVKAHQAVRRLGGVEKCNSFTKIYLALIGQYEWNACPAIPPELILFPRWFYFNVYEMSSWSRAILIPLSIIFSVKPLKTVLPGRGIEELFEEKGRPDHIPFDRRKIFSWKNFFLAADRFLKFYEKYGPKPFRKRSVQWASEWMVQRFELSGGLGAIYPAMVNSIFALRSLGYGNDHPLVVRALKQLEEFEVVEGEAMHLQPCFSPIWDTGLTLVSLTESELDANHPSVKKAVRWLLDKEVRRFGDWAEKVKGIEPGGWYFEFENEFYPDVDDTIMVLMALKRVHDQAQNWPRDSILELEAAMERGLKWVRAMCNSDGGWASFDKDNDKELFTKVPFADHNAMIDPSTADITGRVLEMFSHFRIPMRDKQVQNAISFIRKHQESDGSWYGRWGVNYIYGTWQILKGLYAIGFNMKEEFCQRGAAWLKSCQNPDGGWGETSRSYDDPALKGKGPSTPSQTAWALMGLFSAGDLTSLHVKNGIRYLLETQKNDGTWDEWTNTGTGFPCVFYIKYEYYKIYFPLFALSMYKRLLSRNETPSAGAKVAF
jgi:squalene-hopene/tetraprenyl-beta-curcumene cyclase